MLSGQLSYDHGLSGTQLLAAVVCSTGPPPRRAQEAFSVINRIKAAIRYVHFRGDVTRLTTISTDLERASDKHNSNQSNRKFHTKSRSNALKVDGPLEKGPVSSTGLKPRHTVS